MVSVLGGNCSFAVYMKLGSGCATFWNRVLKFSEIHWEFWNFCCLWILFGNLLFDLLVFIFFLYWNERMTWSDEWWFFHKTFYTPHSLNLPPFTTNIFNKNSFKNYKNTICRTSNTLLITPRNNPQTQNPKKYQINSLQSNLLRQSVPNVEKTELLLTPSHPTSCCSI